MENIEITCVQIISSVGLARSNYIEAIHKAKENDFNGAEECMKIGQQNFFKGHELHLKLFKEESKIDSVGTSILLMHAEDQLMSAEGFKIIAEELIDNSKKIISLEKKLEGIS